MGAQRLLRRREPRRRGLEGRVYVGTLDGRLVALDAGSGDVGLGRATRSTATKPYTITGAPRVVKGKVMIGNGGAEYGVRGYVTAYDAETGALVWRFYTVPGRSRAAVRAPGARGGREDLDAAAGGRLGGGGTVWDSMAYDPELDLLYVGTGNGVALEPRRSAARAAATTSTSRRSWRSGPTPGAWSGTTRPRPATTGTTPRRSTSMLADLELARHAAQGADAGAEERLLLRARPRDRRAALGGAVRARQLGEPRRPRERAAGRGARGQLRRAPALGAAVPERRPPLAPDVVQPRDRAGLHPRARALLPVRTRSRVHAGEGRLEPRRRLRRTSRRSSRSTRPRCHPPGASSRRGTRSGRRPPGRSSTPAPSTAACSRPRAVWSSRARATAASPPTRRRAERSSGRSPPTSGSSRPRSATASTAGSI